MRARTSPRPLSFWYPKPFPLGNPLTKSIFRPVSWSSAHFMTLRRACVISYTCGCGRKGIVESHHRQHAPSDTPARKSAEMGYRHLGSLKQAVRLEEERSDQHYPSFHCFPCPSFFSRLFLGKIRQPGRLSHHPLRQVCWERRWSSKHTASFDHQHSLVTGPRVYQLLHASFECAEQSRA